MSDFQWVPPAGSVTLGDDTFTLLSVGGLGQTVTSNDLPSISGGVIPTRDTLGPKTLLFTVEIFADYDTDEGAGMATALQDFGDAWATTNTDAVINWTIYGLSRSATGRPRLWTPTIDQPASRGVLNLVAQFFVPSGLICAGGTPDPVNF
jgi:hypothetical protein